MNRLIKATMQRAVLVILCIVLILIWGGISAFQMQRDYLPAINNSTLSVTVRASQMQAAQIQQKITPLLVNAVRTADGLQNIETNAYDGGVLLSLYFPMNFDMAKAEQEVNQTLAGIDMPDGAQKPLVTRVTTSSFPILSYSLTSAEGKVDETALRTNVQTDIVKQLKSVPGVADVRVMGAANRGYVMTVRMKDLIAQGFTVDDLNTSLAAATQDWPIGKIAFSQNSVPLQVDGWNRTEQDLKQIPVRNHAGKIVPLSAVAEITNSLTDVKTVTRTDGQPSVQIDVLKTPSASITGVADRVKERVQNLTSIKKGDVQLTPLLDREQELNSSLFGLLREGLLGCLFSMICVFFFYRNVRSTLLIAVSLPISLLATTALLKSMGYTLNILTVSGLIVAMGRIVDDSIVILDNMVRKVKENRDQPLLQRLVAGVTEMTPAILASTATTIAVYVPIAMVGGIVSASFAGFAWSVVIALIVSFFVAVLVVPTLGFLGGKRLTQESFSLEPLAEPVLKFAFRRKKWVLAISLLAFLAAGTYAAFLPVNFLPSGSTGGGAAIKVELSKGSSLSEVDSEVRKVEAQLKTDPEVQTFSSTFGSTFTPQSDDVFDEGGGYLQEPNVANLSVTVKDKQLLNDFITRTQAQLDKISSKAVFTVTNQNISGDDSQMKIMLTGADQKTLDDSSKKVQARLSKIDGLSINGQADTKSGQGKLKLVLNRDKLQAAGVSSDEVLRVLKNYLAQPKDFSMIVNHQGLPGDVQIDRGIGSIQEIRSQLANEMLTAADGHKVRLNEVATLEDNNDPTSIRERDGEPFSVVIVQITSNDISGVSGQVQNALQDAPLPNGVQISYGGISEQVNQMILDMSVALSFSLLLVLMIISSVFRGWRAPLAVLVSVPLSLSGVVLAMFLFHCQWNLAALIGVLMLVGIVVTNGIVMIDKIERNLKEGMELHEAVMSGSLSRVRPILMTAATTILTLLPLAFSHSGDTVVSQTLGVVVVGGMIASTCNSFLVIPIVYELLRKKSVVKSAVSAQTRTV